MRALLIAVLSLISFQVIAAEPYIPNRIVFAYECKQANEAQSYFRCDLKPDGAHSLSGLKLHWVTLPSDMSGAKREQADYLFNKLVLRYFELGGRMFDVTADKWASNTVKGCSAINAALGYTCTTWRETKKGFEQAK